jgi:SAM-dependent methyltransferase
MDQNELSTLYRQRFPEAELARKAAIWKVLCERFFQRYVPPDAAVIDLACGYGEFINHIRAGEKIAVDLNADARSRLDGDVRFEQIGALELATLGREGADLVFTSNFLEHLPDRRSLEQLLDQVLEVLKPRGRFMILGPNLRYLPGAYWDFYDHTLGLTHGSLCEVLVLKGFRIETCIDRFLPYTTRGALPTHPALVRAYLAVPPVWRLLGKQFFVVAQKPGPA